MPNLSILIPSFNDPCLQQVRALKEQADKIENLEYEILVADDASTDRKVKEENRQLALLANCRFLEREKNIGRSAIRNFLAREATYDWLLFLDCEIAIHEHLLSRYVESQGKAQVICGGVKAGGDAARWATNLRYRYETSMQDAYSAKNRTTMGYRSFRTTNFMIDRKLFLGILFNEHITTYGYEDVLFGRELEKAGCHLIHISNEVEMYNYEANSRFVEKTEESLRTLKTFAKEIDTFSPILTIDSMLRKWHLRLPARIIFSLIDKKLRTNLCGHDPKPLYYKLYKLGYFLNLED